MDVAVRDRADTVVTPPHLAAPLLLEPFFAHMFRPSRIGDPASARLFARPYAAVAGRFRQWHERGRISVDDRAAVYLHEFSSGGDTVRGLVGALDLTRRAVVGADRAVLPHEGIHPAQADELADRMEEMHLHPAPILLAHRGSASLRETVTTIAAAPPSRQFEDRSGQRHRIWAIRDTTSLAEIAAEIAGARAVIADGHHRYAAYLRVQARHPGTPADRGLAMLIDQRDTPLQLRAIHRFLDGVTLADLQAAATAAGLTFEYRPAPCGNDVSDDTLVANDGRGWATLRLPARPDRTVVEVLHEAVLPSLPRGPRRIGYHHTTEEALALSARRRGTAVLLPAPTMEQVLLTVAEGRLLPEKATSFQPKPNLGVLMRSLDDE
ncbi:DUF1015 family protein [Nocardioides sp.]|uniref:DUF1015 family protein n=1 Tax=Nocardioides sp. TaxID=35761 RepID=UPI0039E4A0A6